MKAEDGIRLAGKKVILVGAGQSEGDTIGNGRAMAILFARHGAEVFCVDNRLDSAQETVDMIVAEGGKATAFKADITESADCQALMNEGAKTLGRVDILINNVGIAANDRKVAALEELVWDRIFDVNLKGMWMVSKQALPVMKAQKGGVILNISSVASKLYHGGTAYELSKAGVNKLTESIAAGYAQYGIRCNAILPGLMDTPMAVEGTAKATGMDKVSVRAKRDAMVPLGRHQGSGWDTAYAALYLVSDEAKFVTGLLMPVDGGMSLKIN